VVGVVVPFAHWEQSSKSCEVPLNTSSHVDQGFCSSGDHCGVSDSLDTKSWRMVAALFILFDLDFGWLQ
jgi:hypothetical protein